MTDDYFNEHFRFTCCGPNLWRVYNRVTDQSASPVYNSKDAARYYVEQELKLEMEEQMDKLLGGSGDVTRMDDGVALHSGLPTSIKGNGQKEKL